VALYLIPTPLSTEDPLRVLPPATIEAVHGISVFCVEQLPWAVKFLGRIGHPIPSYKLEFLPYHKKSGPQELMAILKMIQSGRDVGVLSEAGAPGIADPGSELAWVAHQRGIEVKPLVGPSSILLAAMSAGMNGQRFAFNGYFPVDADKRVMAIHEFENLSMRLDQAQLFIEAPHRNESLWGALVSTLNGDTRLGVAVSLAGADQTIRTKLVSEWKSQAAPVKNGVPAIFQFYAPK
jgi:16S rRNA (cytidine1402-2'-O)-methyltransferase